MTHTPDEYKRAAEKLEHWRQYVQPGHSTDQAFNLAITTLRRLAKGELVERDSTEAARAVALQSDSKLQWMYPTPPDASEREHCKNVATIMAQNRLLRIGSDVDMLLGERAAAFKDGDKAGYERGLEKQARALTEACEDNRDLSNTLTTLQSSYETLAAAARDLHEETHLDVSQCETDEYRRTWNAWRKLGAALSAAAKPESSDESEEQSK
jgi:hypothetical protein